MKPVLKTLENMTEPQLASMSTAMGKAIEETAKRMRIERPHFTLLIFNDPKIAQYVSNCERGSMVQALRETADRLEKKQDLEREIRTGEDKKDFP